MTDYCDNCRYTPCNARIIVDEKEHKQHLGFCSQECFQKAQQDLLIKDVEWDILQKNTMRDGENIEAVVIISYKELRSLVKNSKITLGEAQKIVAIHCAKKL